MAAFYIPESTALFGGIGEILQNGYPEGRDEDGQLALWRTGPYVPPLTLPLGSKTIVVTPEFRDLMSLSPLAGFDFRPVNKQHIVRLHWERWDWAADEPAEWPPEDDPESYFTAYPHDPECAAEMPPLWEVVLRIGAIVDTDLMRKAWDYDVRVHLGTWNGDRIFLGHCPPNGGPWLIVDDVARDWLTENAGQCMTFEPCPVLE